MTRLLTLALTLFGDVLFIRALVALGGRGVSAFLIRGDARRLPLAAGLQVDSIVTDPPAGIGFMGVGWDTFATPKGTNGHDRAVSFDRVGGNHHAVNPQDKVRTLRSEGAKFRAAMTAMFLEIGTHLKPGGHAFVWALPRTSHWTATALEDAGFEIRDVVVHLFGSGFPKSLDVGKAIDKAARGCPQGGPDPESPNHGRFKGGTLKADHATGRGFGAGGSAFLESGAYVDSAKSEDTPWSGWGTALKPASEHWILARKPLSEPTVAANVLTHGVGGINVDGCRVGMTEEDDGRRVRHTRVQFGASFRDDNWTPPPISENGGNVAGRWPANVCLDPEAAALLDEQSGTLSSHDTRDDGSYYEHNRPGAVGAFAHGNSRQKRPSGRGDTGGASRFFYCAKPSTSERNAGLAPGERGDHPTVKSIALMRWLCRLITPPGGTVLDCFMGSGTTGCAAVLEGFNFIGIERDAHYIDLARRRISYWAAQGRQADMFAELPA